MEYVLRTEIDLERQGEISEIRVMIQSFINDVEEFLMQEKVLS